VYSTGGNYVKVWGRSFFVGVPSSGQLVKDTKEYSVTSREASSSTHGEGETVMVESDKYMCYFTQISGDNSGDWEGGGENVSIIEKTTASDGKKRWYLRARSYYWDQDIQAKARCLPKNQ
jgi:hypothetical protein